MTRREFSREFKIEAARLVTERGVAVARPAATKLPAARLRGLLDSRFCPGRRHAGQGFSCI